MSGVIKHMERSHKTRNKNYSEFRRFSMRALRTSDTKRMRKTFRESFLNRIKNLFSRKKQDR